MPARSKAQQQAMAIAEHHPEKLYARNQGLLRMSHQQLHDFAATASNSLPARVRSMARGGIVPGPGQFNLHGGEMVLPKSITNRMHVMLLRHMLTTGFRPPSGGFDYLGQGSKSPAMGKGLVR